MSMSQEQHINHAAYHQLREVINKDYPKGHFVAISSGRIVADAHRFEELNDLLHRLGNDSRDVLIVQAGIDYPETVTILFEDGAT